MNSSSRDRAPTITAVTSGQAHTPGPWDREMGSGRGAWIGNKGNWTALACGNTDAEAEANARLIAAAPELLRGLKHEVANCPMCKGDGFTAQTFEHIVGRLPKRQKVECPRCKESRAIIAKAEPHS